MDGNRIDKVLASSLLEVQEEQKNPESASNIE
jgi:hypothetical protein